MTGMIVCRGRVSPDCYDGESALRCYEEGDMREDGTWDGETVLCDPCYIALGCPLREQDEFWRRNDTDS